MFQRTACLALVSCALLSAQQDGATILARILAGKGTLSNAELERVAQAAPAERVGTLAALLKDKGLLTDADLAQLSSPVSQPSTGVEAAAPGTTQHARPARPAGPSTDTSAPPVTAESRFPVSIYGTVLMNTFFNTAATNIIDLPLFAAKQGSDALGNDKNLGMTARQTRFGLRYRGPEIAGGRLSGQLEFDLLGGQAPFTTGVNMDLVRTRLAFGRLDWAHGAFEAGQDWSIFAPLNPTSLAEFAIPSMSASGNPWIRLPQLRGEFRGGSKEGLRFLAQIAAVDPNLGDYSTATFSASRAPGAGERGRAPGIESRFALTGSMGDRDLTVGFSSHWAHGKNSGIANGAPLEIPIDSWGVAIDYTLPLARFFQWSGEVFTGRALGMFSVETGQALGAPGGIGALGVHSSGGSTQAQLNLNPKWQVNLVYGIDTPRVRDLPVGSRTRNQSYMGNVMYKYNPHFTIAAEYRRLLTDFRNQQAANERGGHANLAFAYTF